MHDELPRLPRAAGKHGAEDGRVEAPLERRVQHRHVRRRLERAPRRRALLAGAAPGRLARAVPARQRHVVHGHHRRHARLEDALPLLLADVLAVVRARHRLGIPFLLEQRVQRLGRRVARQLRQVVEVVLVPRLADPL